MGLTVFQYENSIDTNNLTQSLNFPHFRLKIKNFQTLPDKTYFCRQVETLLWQYHRINLTSHNSTVWFPELYYVIVRLLGTLFLAYISVM